MTPPISSPVVFNPNVHWGSPEDRSRFSVGDRVEVSAPTASMLAALVPPPTPPLDRSITARPLPGLDSLDLEKIARAHIGRLVHTDLTIRIPLKPGNYEMPVDNFLKKVCFCIPEKEGETPYIEVHFEVRHGQVTRFEGEFFENILVGGFIPVGPLKWVADPSNDEWKGTASLRVGGVPIDITKNILHALELTGDRVPLDLKTLVLSGLKSLKSPQEGGKGSSGLSEGNWDFMDLRNTEITFGKVRLTPGFLEVGPVIVEISPHFTDFEFQHARLDHILIGDWYFPRIRTSDGHYQITGVRFKPFRVTMTEDEVSVRTLKDEEINLKDVRRQQRLRDLPGIGFKTFSSTQIGTSLQVPRRRDLSFDQMGFVFKRKTGDFGALLRGIHVEKLQGTFGEQSALVKSLEMGEIQLARWRGKTSLELKGVRKLGLTHAKLGSYGKWIQFFAGTQPHVFRLEGAKVIWDGKALKGFVVGFKSHLQAFNVYFGDQDFSFGEAGGGHEIDWEKFTLGLDDQNLDLDARGFTYSMGAFHYRQGEREVEVNKAGFEHFDFSAKVNIQDSSRDPRITLNGFVPIIDVKSAVVGQGIPGTDMKIGPSTLSRFGVKFDGEAFRYLDRGGEVHVSLDNVAVTLEKPELRLPLSTNLLFKGTITGKIHEISATHLLGPEAAEFSFFANLDFRGQGDGKIESHQSVNNFTFNVHGLDTQANIQQLVLVGWKFWGGKFGKASFETNQVTGSIASFGGPAMIIDRARQLRAGWDLLTLDLKKAKEARRLFEESPTKGEDEGASPIPIGNLKGMFADLDVETSHVDIRLGPKDRHGERRGPNLKAVGLDLFGIQRGSEFKFFYDLLRGKVYMGIYGGDLDFKATSKGTKVE